MKIQKQALVVSRVRWRAKDSRVVLEPLKAPASYVFWALHTHSMPCVDKHECKDLMRNIQSKHMEVDGFPDIRYNFVIGNHAKILEGRGWMTRSALPRRLAEFRDKSVYIAFAGNGQGTDNKDSYLTDKMKAKFEELVKIGVQNNYIDKKFTLYILARHEEEDVKGGWVSMERWDSSFYIRGNVYKLHALKSPFSPEYLSKAKLDLALPFQDKLEVLDE